MKGGRTPLTPPAPEGLSAERFTVDGIEFVAFSWQSSADLSSLTAAEQIIFQHLLDGESNDTIGRARGCSVRTVANQVASILRKLHVGSRYELIARYGAVHARP